MNIFEAFEKMKNGYIVRDTSGYWYKNENGRLMDSCTEGETWFETLEFKFGEINIDWELVNLHDNKIS